MVAGMKNGEMRRGPCLQQSLMLPLDDFESADAAADVDAGPFGFFAAGDFESGTLRGRNPPPRWRTG